MTDIYKLMHGDVFTALVSIDTESSYLENFQLRNKKEAPFLGNADLRLMRRWWEARAVPASRKMMADIIRRAGCENAKEYLAKNLALSLTDTYWLCPIDLPLTWDAVNLYRAVNYGQDHLPYHNATSYDPNASLGGMMDKFWDMTSKPPVLVKTAYQAFGQQAINEAFATMLHERQETKIPYTRYYLKKTDDGGIQALCRAFTNEDEEFISAMEIVDSGKKANDISMYDYYIKVCSENGLDAESVRDYMDYQTLSDFAISNMDEHLMNFGVLRNTSTLSLISPAPIFDSGNSMFYSEIRTQAFTRKQLLARKYTGFHDKEEAMLRHVRKKNILREELLPSPSEVKDFYAENGIPESRAVFIAESYDNKLTLLREFQQGKSISLWRG